MEMVFSSSYTHTSRKPCMKVKNWILSMLRMHESIDLAAINLKWFSFINANALTPECKSRYCDRNSFGVKICAKSWLVIIHVDGSTSLGWYFNPSMRLPSDNGNIIFVYLCTSVSDYLSRQGLKSRADRVAQDSVIQNGWTIYIRNNLFLTGYI